MTGEAPGGAAPSMEQMAQDCAAELESLLKADAQAAEAVAEGGADGGSEGEAKQLRAEYDKAGLDSTPALFLEEITENTEESNADYLGLQSIADETDPVERAANYKDRGNRVLKLAKENKEVRKKFYKEAAMLYSTGLDVKCNDATLNSQLAGNRAHVHTLLGNYRKAINDADLALSHDPKAVKAAFRGAKAALNIPDFAAADRFCVQGLQLEPDNEELQALGKKAAAAKEAEEAAKREAEARLAAGLALADAIQKDRGLTVGTAQFDGGNRTPALANDGSMVWPVTLLYPQSMSSDIIQAFPETDTFGPHLDVMFGQGAPPLEWDTQGEYTRARVELYWARRAGAKGLTRQQLAEVLLHNGVPGEDAPDPREADGNFVEWVRVEEGSTLKDLLAQKGHVIGGLHPCFFCVARGGEAKRKFLHAASPALA